MWKVHSNNHEYESLNGWRWIHNRSCSDQSSSKLSLIADALYKCTLFFVLLFDTIVDKTLLSQQIAVNTQSPGYYKPVWKLLSWKVSSQCSFFEKFWLSKLVAHYKVALNTQNNHCDYGELITLNTLPVFKFVLSFQVCNLSDSSQWNSGSMNSHIKNRSVVHSHID